MSDIEKDNKPIGIQELTYYHERMKAYIDDINADCAQIGHTHTTNEVFDEGYIKKYTNPFDIRRLSNYNTVLTRDQLYGSIDLDVDTYGTFVFSLMGTVTINMISANNNDNDDSKSNPEDLSKEFSRKVDFFIEGNGNNVEWSNNVEWIIGENKLAPDVVTYISMVTSDNGNTWYASNLTYAGGLVDVTVDGVEIATDDEAQEMIDDVFSHKEETEPEPVVEEKSGTLNVSGELGVDLVVDGNIKAGTISGNVKASGTITYASLLGTIEQGVDVGDEYDIKVENGELDIALDVLIDGFTGNYTVGAMTNTSGTKSTINCELEIDTTDQNAIYNNGGTITVTENGNVQVNTSYTTGRGIYNVGNGSVFNIENGGAVTVVVDGSNSRGVYNYESAEFVVDGILNTTGVSYGLYNNSLFTVNRETRAFSDGTPISNNGGTINGIGKVYANNDLYYDGED